MIYFSCKLTNTRRNANILLTIFFQDSRVRQTAGSKYFTHLLWTPWKNQTWKTLWMSNKFILPMTRYHRYLKDWSEKNDMLKSASKPNSTHHFKTNLIHTVGFRHKTNILYHFFFWIKLRTSVCIFIGIQEFRNVDVYAGFTRGQKKPKNDHHNID